MNENNQMETTNRHSNIPNFESGACRKDPGEILRQFEERRQTIIEDIEEGYIETDLKGNTIFCNDSFCRIVGYPKEEVIGLSYRTYLSEPLVETVYSAYNGVYRRGIPNKGFVYQIMRKNGEMRIIESSISLVKDSEGHRIGFHSIVRDITERKRTEEELEKHRTRMQTIFSSIKDSIITVDTGMTVVEANKATEQVCGVPGDKMIGKPFCEHSTQCSRNCQQAIKEALSSQTTIREYQIECRHARRSRQRVSVTVSPLMIRDGEFKGSVVVIRDITRLHALERELRERHHFHRIIGKSRKMQESYDLLTELADVETTVLISGESGTGKSLAAKSLHYGGSRALEPLVILNCSILSENLLESELFGHVKGAFTGAIKDTQGRFQTAQNGTIVLDEIGDISPRIQLKLLRVLEEKEFERVGESAPTKVNARVVACTNRNLKEKVRCGEFREDLYYRLKVVEVPLPPLRDRLEDIPLLIEHFCGAFNKSFKKNIQGPSDEVLSAFMNYRWPGNVRELEHSIEHAFVLCHGPIILLEHIPAEIREFSGVRKCTREARSIEGLEKIRAVLGRTDWNKAKAARILGMDRSTLYRKMTKYGISMPQKCSAT